MALEIKTIDDAKKIIKKRNVEYVKVGVFDIDGIFRGKYMQASKFIHVLDKGFGYCNVVLGWDSNDQLYETKGTITGWQTGYSDAPVKIVPESCRELPLEKNTLLFIGEFDGKFEQVCPRGLLKRVVKKAETMGFAAKMACEFEFFMFNETADTIREKNYQNLVNLSPGFFGYSMLRCSEYHEFYEEMLSLCKTMRFPLEGLHTETGPGVIEAAIYYDDILESADQGALFKTYTKILAKKWNWLATFMAKWSKDYPGQSGHLHLSLQDLDGKSVFYDKKSQDCMSDTMRYFIGGQQALMPELLSMVSPTINSFSRLIPGFWAPTKANWGVDNRTCSLRAIPGSEESQRVEYRVTAADINPYIAGAAALGSGLWGIENRIDPGVPVDGNAYDKQFPLERRFPETLNEAAYRLEQSQAARELFGDVFVEHYAATRKWESQEYQKHISDWELKRYLEII
jgi:glutamine synthetase